MSNRWEAEWERSLRNREAILKQDIRDIIKRRTVDLVQATEKVGTVIFCDHGARPLRYLYERVYPFVYPDRELPNILSLNFGKEKWQVLLTYIFDSYDPRIRSEFLPSGRIDSVASLEEIYGKEHITGLLNLLSRNTGENRLIVDEVQSTGKTEEMALKIFPTLDPSNVYSFFTFFDSENDRNAVGRVAPWHGIYPDFSDARSFFTDTSDWEEAEVDKNVIPLEREFDSLIQEMVSAQL